MIVLVRSGIIDVNDFQWHKDLCTELTWPERMIWRLVITYGRLW